MSKLLLDEHPLQVLPGLAVKIGLAEAIALQQLHYWLKTSPHWIDGEPWYYRSAKEWQDDFPFWSRATCHRVFANLEEYGLVKSGNFNKLAIDRTKWYTIVYEAVTRLESGELSISQNEQSEKEVEAPAPIAQNETPLLKSEQPSSRNELPSRVDEQPSSRNELPLPETSTETSTEISTNNNIAPAAGKSHENEKYRLRIQGVSGEEFGAVFTDVDEAMGGMRPGQCKRLKDLWDEFPYFDAHAHAYDQTKQYAKFFNLGYYEECVKRFVAAHPELKREALNGSHRGVEAKTTGTGPAGTQRRRGKAKSPVGAAAP